MAPGTAAPIRDPSRNDFKSPLKKAARRIVTAPTFNVIRTIDFDKKSEYEKFIQFIDSSNKELAKIKLKKPEIDSRLASILPIYLPGMTELAVQGKSLQLSWFKRILENWKKFVKWFKQSKRGKQIRNLMARWKKLEREMKKLFKNIKSIKWKDLLNRVKDNKFIKGLTDWIKSPKKWPKLPKWPKEFFKKDIFKGFKDAYDKLRNLDFKKILGAASWIKGIANIIVGKASPWGLFATTVFQDVMNNPVGEYSGLQGPSAWFNNPSLDVEEIYSQLKMHGHETDVKRLEALGMNKEVLEKYIKFLKQKAELAEKYGSEYLNLNTKSSIDAELAQLEESISRLVKEQLYIRNNPGEIINEGRVWNRNRNELEEVLHKKAYLQWKKRDVNDDNNQSNIQSNNNFDLSQIYSMDSKMFDSGYALLNNAPQLYVMESEGKTQYVPFTAGASSDISSSSFMEIDYSQFNSKLLDELRFVKLSGG
mgnify:CR=1 FL=1|tara:strand:- start:1349 stop:2785 length:1437 start_codon:yes stop_codon:yes gene_type:complete